MLENRKQYLHCIIMILLMFSGFIFPPIASITPLGMKVCGVFLGMMWGWLCLDLTFPSILGMCVLAIGSYGTATGIFSSGFASEVVLVVILFTTFTAYISSVGLPNTVAQWFISRKIIKGKPYLFILLFWILTFVLGILVDIYPTIFMLWPVIYTISEDLGYAKKDKFPSYMCFGITFIGGVGAVCKPFSMWGLTGYGVFEAAMGVHIDYLQYTIYTGIISVIMILLYALVVPRIIGIDLTPFKEGNYHIEQSNYTQDQKIASVFTIILFVVLYLPSVLPDEWVLTLVLKKQLGTVGCVALLICIVAMIHRNGEPLVRVADLAHQGVPFNMVFMVAATIVIGGAMKSQDTGIVTAITESCSPILSTLSPILFYIVLILLYGVATQFLHNAALLTIFTPIACTFALEIGANVIITFMIGMIVLSSALMTPAASTRSGLVFSNVWIDKKMAYLLGFLAVLLTGIAMFLIGIPLGNIMFPM